MFQQAYAHVDSFGSSGISPATANAFLANAEGQDRTDGTDATATVETEEGYCHTGVDAQRRTEGESMDGDFAVVSLDTETHNLQEDPNGTIDENAQFLVRRWMSLSIISLRGVWKITLIHART